MTDVIAADVMRVVFVTVTVLSAAYFGFAKRRFDFFSAAFAGCFVYFSPGWFGYGSFHVGGVWQDVPLVWQTYVVLTGVTLAVLIAAVLNDVLLRPPALAQGTMTLNGKQYGLELLVLAVGTNVALLAMLLTSGDAVFSAEKQEMLDGLNRWHIAFVTLSQVGFCLAILTGRIWWSAVFFMMLLFDVYLGFRSGIAMALGAVFTAVLMSQGPQRLLLKRGKFVAAGVFCVLVVLVLKGYMGHIKAGNWEFILSERMNFESILLPIARNESFVAAATLNEIIASGYNWELESYLARGIAAWIPFGNVIISEVSEFAYQDQLFPEVDYGMASTPWGESWSAGGGALLLVAVVTYVTVLGLANRVLPRVRPPVASALLVALAYWCFYVHRNSVEFQFVLEKRLVILALVLMFLRLLFSSLGRRAARNNLTTVAEPGSVQAQQRRR